MADYDRNLLLYCLERARLKLDLGELDAEKGDMRISKCEVCRKKKNIKRCTGCYTVWYCGQKCQMKGWKEHKDECKKAKEEYTNVLLRERAGQTTSFLSGKVYAGDQVKPKKSHFLVKVQVPLDNPSFPLLVYNENRSVMGELWKEGNELAHAELNKVINEGFIPGKGYFRAIFTENQLKINPVRAQPVQVW